MREPPAETTTIPAHVRRACQTLTELGSRYFYGSGPFSTRIVAIHHRPYSSVHAIDLTDGATERRFYLKTLTSDPSTRARRIAQCMNEYGQLEVLSKRFAGFRDLGVIEPVACWPEDLAFLSEEFPGRNLELVLRTHVRHIWSKAHLSMAMALCFRAGQWLRHFQSWTVPQSEIDLDVDELMQYCEFRLRKIQDGTSGIRSHAVLQRLAALAETFGPADRRVVGRHNDFRPDNMLARNGRLVVVDFAGFTYGPPLYDYIKFWMRLDYMAYGPLPVTRAIRALQTSFAAGYDQTVDLTAPMAEFLRIANLLDKIWDLTTPSALSFSHRVLERRWHRHLIAQLHNLVER